METLCLKKKKKKIENRLEGNTLPPKKTVLSKQCKNTKTKLLIHFIMTVEKLNKDAFLTKTGLSYLPSLFFSSLDIHITEYLKKNFSYCVKTQSYSNFSKRCFIRGILSELTSKNLTLTYIVVLYL